MKIWIWILKCFVVCIQLVTLSSVNSYSLQGKVIDFNNPDKLPISLSFTSISTVNPISGDSLYSKDEDDSTTYPSQFTTVERTPIHKDNADDYPDFEEEWNRDVSQKFINGKLIYKPNPANDEGMVELRIAEVKDSSGRINPLKGTFDLSNCGDAYKYLSISTGYRRGMKPENYNKVEIWICPRFLLEEEINQTAQHFQLIMKDWKKDVSIGIFWMCKSKEENKLFYNFEPESLDEISKDNLFVNWSSKKSQLSKYYELKYENGMLHSYERSEQAVLPEHYNIMKPGSPYIRYCEMLAFHF